MALLDWNVLYGEYRDKNSPSINSVKYRILVYISTQLDFDHK